MHNMQDAGIALMESMDADIHDNTFENVKYGIRLSLGCARNRVYRNTFATCRDCETSSVVLVDIDVDVVDIAAVVALRSAPACVFEQGAGQEPPPLLSSLPGHLLYIP